MAADEDPGPAARRSLPQWFTGRGEEGSAPAAPRRGGRRTPYDFGFGGFVDGVGGVAGSSFFFGCGGFVDGVGGVAVSSLFFGAGFFGPPFTAI